MGRIYICFLFLSFIITLFSCGKDSIDDQTWTVPDEPVIIVESARMVTGITDEKGNRVDGLTAAFGDTIRLVNKGDYFQFKGNKLNKRGEVLYVTDQDGNKYEFTQSPVANDVSYFHQVVIKEKQSMLHKSHLALNLFFNNQLSVSIPANSFKKSLQPYSGDVSIKYFTYDIQNEYHRAALPGGLTGFIENGNRQLLNMVTAFSFDVKSSTSEPVVFDQATLISAYLNSYNTLFHYNESTHNWEEVVHASGKPNEVAIYRSGHYCIAQSRPFVRLNGRMLSNGLPVPNQKVEIRYQQAVQTIFTSNSGRWEALVPANEEISYTYVLPCLDKTYKIAIPNEDIRLQDDDLTTLFSATRFTGNVVNCEGKTISNGFIRVEGSDFQKVVFLEQSAFEVALPHCQTSSLYLSAFDAETGETGPSFEWQAGLDHQVYNLFACNNLKENYLEVHNAEGSLTYHQLYQRFESGRLVLEARDAVNTANVFKIIFPVEQSGVQAADRVNLVWNDIRFAGEGISFNCANAQNCGFEYLDLTHLSSQPDGWVRGHFKGRLWCKIISTLQAGYVNVEGSFQFKRKF